MQALLAKFANNLPEKKVIYWKTIVKKSATPPKYSIC